MHSIFLIGVTSSLGIEFIRTLFTHRALPCRVLAFIRPATSQLSQNNRIALNSVINAGIICEENEFDWNAPCIEPCQIVTISYDGSESDLLTKFKQQYLIEMNSKSVFINLSTYSFLDILHFVNNVNMPSLAIGSGAVVDWAAGRMKMSDYIETKLRSEREATTTVHPGFYLKDTPNNGIVPSPFPWHGLHVDTYHWMFAENFDPTRDWGKAKYLTSVRSLITLLLKWIADPVKGNFALGTYAAYPRWMLRTFAGFTDVPDDVKTKYPFNSDAVYSKESEKCLSTFNLENFEPNLMFSCTNAKLWTHDHSSDFITYTDLLTKKQ